MGQEKELELSCQLNHGEVHVLAKQNDPLAFTLFFSLRNFYGTSEIFVLMRSALYYEVYSFLTVTLTSLHMSLGFPF